MYRPPGCEPPIPRFLAGLEPKLMEKVARQIFYLADTPPALWREPHIKHFSLEKYSQLYELREKNKILVRVIFTVCGGDIVLLTPFVKHQPRDTMKALEHSLRILADLRECPERIVEFSL